MIDIEVRFEFPERNDLSSKNLYPSIVRKDRPLIKVDCASLPANLIESEFFGHHPSRSDAQT